MSDKPLSACPFCGGDAVIATIMEQGFEIKTTVMCGNMECGVQPSTGFRFNKFDAMAWWNKRREAV